MANRVYSLTALGTLLTRPRLGFFCDRDAVLLADVFETVDESAVRPEIVRLLVHNWRPVRRENALDVTKV